MLKHLPEGLVPFEDCGFARHPFAPLAMEPVRVDCRVDAEDGRPVLRLRVDGGPESEIAPESTDGRHYHFGLGGFALGQKVGYRIVTRREESRVFTFEPLRERQAAQPRGGPPARSVRWICRHLFPGRRHAAYGGAHPACLWRLLRGGAVDTRGAVLFDFGKAAAFLQTETFK